MTFARSVCNSASRLSSPVVAEEDDDDVALGGGPGGRAGGDEPFEDESMPVPLELVELALAICARNANSSGETDSVVPVSDEDVEDVEVFVSVLCDHPPFWDVSVDCPVLFCFSS